MAAGFLVAVSLAALTIVKVDPGSQKVSFRDKNVYQSHSTVLLTQPGFPWGRAVQGYTPTLPGQPSSPVGDSERLTELTNLYVEMANGDAVQTMATRRLKDPDSTVAATHVFMTSPTGYVSALPMISLVGRSDTPAKAVAAAHVGVQSLRAYLTRQQAGAGIPADDRVVLQELRRPDEVKNVGGPKKTMPVVVFLTVMTAVLALAFILENLRPGIRPVSDREEGITEHLRARRSA